ncbi:hypothetical protein K6U06_04290 [Acidiferrimicrobium sp. IK]|uniref:hypothetical protein n=1 Tax=Acidiferrimicrobium sp. IK TaxID=2871700 RepID=UPI0021CB83E6|nr:hypothetical protein [Acidiferrimicrobium sp. IK]MCU4183567.1 hypothetical protein [Acidiferrimicrobium sp. IK]
MAKRRELPLEIEVPEWAAAQPPDPGPRRPPTRRRWALVAIVVVAVVVWVVFPLRSARATDDLRSLSRSWSTAAALDVERATLMSRIGGLSKGSEPWTRIDAVYSALEKEEARTLLAVRAHLAGRGRSPVQWRPFATQ